MNTLEIPSSVKIIGSQAFYGCSKLKSISFDQGSELKSIGEQTFSNCTALEFVTFNNASKLTEIGEQTFASCNNVKRIILPLVTVIGNNAFIGCSNLETVEFNQNLSFIKSSLDQDHLEKLTILSAYCFYECSKLKEFEVPSSVTIISDFSFFGCSSLSNLVLPNDLEALGSFAFSSCGLKNVLIHGNNLTSLGSSSFAINPNLIAVYYCGTKIISDLSIFNGCNKDLKIITLLQYPANSFCGVSTSKEMYGCMLFPTLKFSRPAFYYGASPVLYGIASVFYTDDEM